MNGKTFRLSAVPGLFAGSLLLATLTGCIAEGSYRSHSSSPRTVAQVNVGVGFEDDYDYYPGYETYYSRSRHEFVYRNGGHWVRRPEPRGVSATLLLAAPSVRMEFRDAPERHHNTVARTYPKNWKPQAAAHDATPRHNDERRTDRKNDHQDDTRRQ